MAIFKCKMCGGELEITGNSTVAECIYCGTQQTIPTPKDENLQGLFNRANVLRMKSEFDKAEQLYEKLVQMDNTQSEAYWGLILSKYGIEYVEDPATLKRVPTCHRTSLDSIIADEDYKSALQYADAKQRALYEAEAKEIDRLQKEIIALSQKEEPYDVFICYKETDASGKRTQDSVIANDIYYQLTQQGFKVFYAAITLEDKLGSAYEPCIFAALNSSKVMLSIGTKPEYFNAVWVKNEWSRFLKMMKKDRSKLLIPCYRDMDAYELPEEFAHLQAQDMSKIGFINDVVRGISKVLSVNEPKETKTETVVVNTNSSNTAPLLKRAFMFLEDGDWSSANEYCEKVLDLDPECADAYIGKLMVDLKVKKQDKLKDCSDPFDKNNNYQKALRFGDDKLKSKLKSDIEHIKERNENARLEKIYTEAYSIYSSSSTEDEYKKALALFAEITQYKDAKKLSKECLDKAETARKNKIYTKACEVLNDTHTWIGKATDIRSFAEAVEQFQSLNGWKDSEKNIELCKAKINEIKAERLEKERQAEIARKEAERIAKRNKKIAIITTPIVCAIIAFVIVLNTIIIPTSKYNDAVALMDAGNLDDAYSIFIELGDYKDAADKSDDIRLQKTKEQLKNIKVGSYITFGAYEQDNNTSNGKEDVEWLVLEVKDGKALVISKYALDCRQYSTSRTDVTWDASSLRIWLNNNFITSTFSDEEKTMISTVTVSADKNPEYNTDPGKETQDQVFLLSIDEVNRYFSSDSARQCNPTDYAVANEADVSSFNDNCFWWLRSPGFDQKSFACVYSFGEVSYRGACVDSCTIAIRPALWIELK